MYKTRQRAIYFTVSERGSQSLVLRGAALQRRDEWFLHRALATVAD